MLIFRQKSFQLCTPPLENLTTRTTIIFIDVLDMNVLEINQEKQYGIWGYKIRFMWNDHRLEWPKECQNNKSQTNLHTLRSDLLDFLWNPITIFQEVAGRNFGQRQPSYEKSISIGQVKLLLTLLLDNGTFLQQLECGYGFACKPF